MGREKGRLLRTNNCEFIPMSQQDEGGLSRLKPKWLEQDVFDDGRGMLDAESGAKGWCGG